MPVRITFADIRAHSAAWQGACLPGRGFCRPTDSAIRLASANRPGFEKPPAGSCSMDVFARSAQDRPSMATVRFCRANKTLSTVFVSIIAQRFPLFNSFCAKNWQFLAPQAPNGDFARGIPDALPLACRYQTEESIRPKHGKMRTNPKTGRACEAHSKAQNAGKGQRHCGEQTGKGKQGRKEERRNQIKTDRHLAISVGFWWGKVDSDHRSQ